MNDHRSTAATRSPAIKKPGVRTIAKATGLSVATVSRVLNDAPNVRAETRDQVLATMRELGYTPNSAARALATRRTRTIAAVIPTLAHSIFASFLNAIEVELASAGYALVIATTDGDPAIEFKRAHDLLNMGAEGLIISGLVHDPELFELIGRQQLPTICTSVFDPTAPLPTVGYDNSALGAEAVAYLHSLGHSRIAVVHGPVENSDRTALRLAGVAAGAGAEVETVLCPGTLDASGGAEAARKILGMANRPGAILCLSDVLALGVLFELARAGVSVPRDISVMGFDDLDWASLSTPPLTTIRLPSIRMGHVAARALVENLEYGTAIASQRIDARIVVRESTAPCTR